MLPGDTNLVLLILFQLLQHQLLIQEGNHLSDFNVFTILSEFAH